MCNNADLQQINSELIALYEFCRKNNFSQEDIANLSRPLTIAITKSRLRKRLLQVAVITLLTASVYYIATTDIISWQLSAIGRITLIQILPIWNWQHLKNEKCLISTLNPTEAPKLECTLCEALNQIHLSNIDIDPAFLKQHYIDLHTPLIITDALTNWTQINLQDSTLANSVPCKLSTNIHSGFTTTSRILAKLDDFDQYFLHFQNCDFNAMKVFRVFTPKPLFLPAELSPVQYNWLLMSRNYNVSMFKYIELQEPISLFGQIQGGNHIRLTPRLNCENICPLVEMELVAGEALIFTSMWDLEYKPNALQDNVAVILEMH